MYETYEKYIKSLKYKLSKFETFEDLPCERQIDNIYLYYNNNNYTIQIVYKNINNSHYRAIHILEHFINDPAWENETFSLKYNEILIHDNSIMLKDSFEKIFNELTILPQNEENKINLILNKQLFEYEKSCVIYKIFPNCNPTHFLFKQLDELLKNK